MGRSMDRVDQGCIGQALEYAPDGRVVNWSDSNLGARYQVTPTQTFHDRQNRNCRKYEIDVIRDGANHKVYGTACRDIDGSWRAVK